MNEVGSSDASKTDPIRKLAKIRVEDGKISIFLGAGASALGGYRTFLTFPHMFWPTSTEPAILSATDKERVLLSSIRRELERKRKPLTLDQFLWILNSYNMVLQNSFSDEELRSRFSDSLLLWSRMQELNQLVQRARKNICDLTIAHYREPPSASYSKYTRQFYSGLFTKFQHIEIFTTNYDVVPEYLFSRNNFFIERCKSKWGQAYKEIMNGPENLGNVKLYNGIPKFDDIDLSVPPNQDSADLQWHRSTYEKTENPSVSVFRLHGCVAWFYGQQLRNARINFDMRSLEQIDNSYDRICVMYPGKEEMVGRDPHAFGFERLYLSCLESSTLVFIGFALRDSDVASVVFSAIRQRNLNETKPLKIVVIDPFISEEDFLQRLKQRRIEVSIPMEINKEHLRIVTIRSNFPPSNRFETDNITRMLV